MAMTYPLVAIPESDVPIAREPALQHLLDTYASETNKVFSIWSGLRQSDIAFRPHPRSSAVGEALRHQLLSERRFLGELLGTPEVDATEVLPKQESLEAFAARLVELARPRLAFLSTKPLSWWQEPVPFFDVERERIWVFWRRILHTAHHRTQLTVYERLLDQPVLPTYGPTADVTWDGADPTLTVDAATRG